MTNQTPTTGIPRTRRRAGTGTWRERGWKQLSLRIPPDVHLRLRRQAERAEMPDVDYVRQAVLDKLARDEAEAR